MKVEQHTTQSAHNRNSGFVSANGVARTDLAFPQRWPPVRDQENKILVSSPRPRNREKPFRFHRLLASCTANTQSFGRITLIEDAAHN
jgi:hypothetical protein